MPAPVPAFATSLCRELTFTGGVSAHQPHAMHWELFVVVVDLFASLGQSHAQREDVSVLAFWWLTQILNWLLDAWCSAVRW